MTRVFLIEHEEDRLRWDAWVERFPGATLFHSTRWRDVVEQSYGYTGYYLAAGSQECLRGILPLFLCGNRLTGRLLVALPYAATQPSLCAEDTETEQALIEAAMRLGYELHADAVELRENRTLPWGWTPRQVYVNFQLALDPDPQKIWETALESRARTKTRQAMRYGLTTRWGRHNLLGAFYGLYTHTMRRLGSPPHSLNFFERILHHFKDRTDILLVLYDDRPAAGALIMRDIRWIGFPWAASHMDYHPLRPNNLLYWSLIEHACRNEYAFLDMGRSPEGSGPVYFKTQWGAVSRPLFYYRYHTGRTLTPADPSTPAIKRASRLWRRLPEPFCNRLGPRLARLIP